MKPFVFQNFTVFQDAEVFRVGTDAMLLGAFCDISNANNILEIGTGTGVISLMLAQRNTKAKILAIDINPTAVKLAERNFKNSPYSKKLSVTLHDVKAFKVEEKFDLVVCNPPFFAANNSSKDVLARQQKELDFSQLISHAKTLLSEHGILSIILPSDSSQQVEELAIKNHLFLKKKINVFGIEGGGLKRNILEFSPLKLSEEIFDFAIEKSPRKYSDAYIELTKEFHVFSKKE